MRTPEEILEVCREAWREAALRDTKQARPGIGRLPDFDSFCAASLVEETCKGLKLITSPEYLSLKFHCPEHSRDKYLHPLPHFNDCHGWDWLTLATKLGVEPYTLQT